MVVAHVSAVTLDEPFEIVVAAVVGTLAVARLTRLAIDDDFPPVMWARQWYVRHVPEAWQGLAECPWCASFWIALADVLVAWATDLHWGWWLFNTVFAVAWVAAFLCARDIPPDARS